MMINQNNEKSIAKLSQGGVPSYAGLTGNALLAAVVATGTVGFALFGYGECLFLYATGQQSAIPRIVAAPAEFSASIQAFSPLPHCTSIDPGPLTIDSFADATIASEFSGLHMVLSGNRHSRRLGEP